MTPSKLPAFILILLPQTVNQDAFVPRIWADAGLFKPTGLPSPGKSINRRLGVDPLMSNSQYELVNYYSRERVVLVGLNEQGAMISVFRGVKHDSYGITDV